MKTRSVDVKTNFKKKFSNTNMFCRLCKTVGEEESEIHLLKCKEIIGDSFLKNQISNISYSDIFGTLEQQIKAVKVWKVIFKVWNLKLESQKLSPSGHQAHLLQGQSASYPCTAAQTVDSSSSDDSTCTVYDFG